jgi:hypothetical protein
MRNKDIEGLKVPLFNRNQANNADVIALMAGGIPCAEYKSPQSEAGFWYVSVGVTYMCRVSVPPDPNEFIGQISVGWKKQPTADMAGYLTIAADMITKQK